MKTGKPIPIIINTGRDIIYFLFYLRNFKKLLSNHQLFVDPSYWIFKSSISLFY